MSEFIPWNSQSLEMWAERHAEGKLIELDGRRTHFIECGQGKPVILIHGFNLDSNTWIKNFDALAAQFKIYALDLWGMGYSTRQPLDYGYGLFAEQLRLFIEALGIHKASLVGHSMGGGTSIVFSSKNPHKIDKLVLLDSAGIPTRLPFRTRIFRLKGLAEFFLSLPTDMIRRKNLLDFWIHKNELLTADIYHKLTLFQKIKGSTEALLTILRKDFFNTVENEIRELGKLNIPTLIIWGREEKTLPISKGQEMHYLIPGSRLEIIDQAGHLANFDQADQFNELVIDFLKD